MSFFFSMRSSVLKTLEIFRFDTVGDYLVGKTLAAFYFRLLMA